VVGARPEPPPRVWPEREGNDHSAHVEWYVLTRVDEFSPGALDSLVAAMVADDNMSWLLLPTDGFRL
jgi:hypothetical protein